MDFCAAHEGDYYESPRLARFYGLMAMKWASRTNTPRDQALTGADLQHLVDTICQDRRQYLHQSKIPPYTEAEERLQRAIDVWLEIEGRRALQKAIWDFNAAYLLVFGPEESSWESLLKPTCFFRVTANAEYMRKRTDRQSKANSLSSMSLVRKTESFQPWPLTPRPSQFQRPGYPSCRESTGQKPPVSENTKATFKPFSSPETPQGSRLVNESSPKKEKPRRSERLNATSESLGETLQMRLEHVVDFKKRLSRIRSTTDETGSDSTGELAQSSSQSPSPSPSPSSSPCPSPVRRNGLKTQATPCKLDPLPQIQAAFKLRPSRGDNPTKDGAKLPKFHPSSVKSIAGCPPAKTDHELTSHESAGRPMGKRMLDCEDIGKPIKPKRLKVSHARGQTSSPSPSQGISSHTTLEASPAPSPVPRVKPTLAATVPSTAARPHSRPPPGSHKDVKAARRCQHSSESSEVESSQEDVPARERKRSRDSSDRSRSRSSRRKERRKKQKFELKDIKGRLRELETLFSTYTAMGEPTRRAR